MIFRIPNNGAPSTDWRDLNRDGTVSWVEKAAATAGATFLLCLGAWTLLQFLYVGACFLFGVKWAAAWDFYMPRWFGGTIVIVAGAGLALFVWRMVTPEKSERLARAELEHQRRMQRLELREREIQIQRMSETVNYEPGTPFTDPDIDSLAIEMMRRYYDGRPWSRRAMEDLGYSQDLWNEANGKLKARGIRDGEKTKLIPESYAQAYAMFIEGQHKTRGRYKVRNGEVLERF